MNDADKMREAFEVCVSKLKYLPPVLTLDEDGDYDTHNTSQLYSVWKEATAKQNELIAELEIQLKDLYEVLTTQPVQIGTARTITRHCLAKVKGVKND